jgi:hypothetical protein
MYIGDCCGVSAYPARYWAAFTHLARNKGRIKELGLNPNLQAGNKRA